LESLIPGFAALPPIPPVSWRLRAQPCGDEDHQGGGRNECRRFLDSEPTAPDQNRLLALPYQPLDFSTSSSCLLPGRAVRHLSLHARLITQALIFQHHSSSAALRQMLDFIASRASKPRL
jgi:hypothetical protein